MRLKTEEIVSGVYLIGGPNVTRGEDAAVYLIDFSDELVLIDSGAGGSSSQIARNIEMLGLNPASLSKIILTHCHIDHIGSAPFFREKYGTKIVIHELDAEALETGDSIRTAANWYGTIFPPTKIDEKLKDAHVILKFGEEELHCLHTPGHTPVPSPFISIGQINESCSVRIFMALLTRRLTPTSMRGKNPCTCFLTWRPTFYVKATSAFTSPKIKYGIILNAILRNTNSSSNQGQTVRYRHTG